MRRPPARPGHPPGHRPRTRPSRALPALLVAAGLLATVGDAALLGSAAAETGPGRTDVRVSVLADSTAPDDPHDGTIPTFDLARFRVDLSRNGADSAGPVRAVVVLGHGAFADADPATADFDLPTACAPGSTVSPDRATLTCDVGPLRQGTAMAFEWAARAAGHDLAGGERLTTTVTVDGAPPVTGPALTIEGAPYVDVAKRPYIFGSGATDGAYLLRYLVQVRPTGPTGKGGLPLRDVSFTEDFSAVLAEFPGTTVSLADPEPGWGGPPAGTWTVGPAAGGRAPVTVTGLDGPPDADGFVAATVVDLRIPVAEVPLGRRVPVVNRVTGVTGRSSDGTTVAESTTANNDAPGEVFREPAAGGLNGVSAWIDPSSTPLATYPVTVGHFRPVAGSWSAYIRGYGGPGSVSSTGDQRAHPGQAVVAESAAGIGASFVAGNDTDLLTCTKFTTPVTVTGDATATAEGTWDGPGPQQSLWDRLHSVTARIEYSADASTATAGRCTDGAWSTTRPATVRAVRASVDLGPARAELASGNLNPGVVLRVPVVVPAGATSGDLVRFHNVAAHGRWAAGAITDAGIVDVLGTTAPAAYDSVANAGNPRYGDRLVVGRGWGEVDKTVCDAPPGPRTVVAGGAVDYCLVGRFEGSAPLRGVVLVDDGGLGRPGGPLAFVPGSATVAVGGNTGRPIAPAIDAATGTLTFAVGTVPVAGGSSTTVTVRFRARADASRPEARPGAEHRNVARLTSPDLPPADGFPDAATSPYLDDQDVVFRSAAVKLHLEKSTSSPSVDYPGRAVDWDLVLANQGEAAIGRIDVIDVLPHAGDGAVPRVPGSAFHGRVGLVGPVDATGTVTYAAAEPGSVSSDPGDASNLPGGATTWCAASALGTAGCPASWSAVTALRVADDGDLAAGASRTITVPMSTAGNRAGDRYTNDAGAVVREGDDGPVLPVRSNDVTVAVESPGLSVVKATEDQAFGPGTANTYRITATNDGKLAEPAAVVADVLREGLVFASASDGGTYDPATRAVTWPPRRLAPGEHVSYSVAVTVAVPMPPSLVDDTGRIPNTATVRGDEDCVAGASVDASCSSTVTNPPVPTRVEHLTTGPTTTSAAPPSTTVPGEAVARRALPRTGAGLVPTAVIGAGLAALGALVLRSRRRISSAGRG
jgi:uncharacterized repeat protein (TIGR01451 family)/LPXTG-motif cell wall-anchored protein